MENTNINSGNSRKKLIITVISLVLAVLIIVPLLLIIFARRAAPIKFLVKNDLSKYVDVAFDEAIDYNEIRPALVAGYDLFRVGLTENYLSSSVYVYEGSTLDFTVAVETVERNGDEVGYTAVELAEDKTKIVGYRPFSDENDLFFDEVLVQLGTKDSYGEYYITKNQALVFTLTLPEQARFGALSGKEVRMTLTVTDYVTRYLYMTNGYDSAVTTVSSWFSSIISKTVKNSENTPIEVGDVVVYDCKDTAADGTVTEYKGLSLEVGEDYLQYFENRVAGESFDITVENVKEDFTILSVHKKSDIAEAVRALGYKNEYALREELRIWCYAVYSDGLMAIMCDKFNVEEYPQSLISTYTKLEDDTWETDFRESAASMAAAWGEAAALEAYGITGYDTVKAYLDELVANHVKTLVGELLISYAMADELGILDTMYEYYLSSLDEYLKAYDLTKKEALADIYYNSDEACIFYTNFLSPALGVKLASTVDGLDILNYISDDYLTID